MDEIKNKQELDNKIEILSNIYFCKDMPNVIYGIPGVGKRFLAKEIILKLKELIPNLKVIGTEEDFLTEEKSNKFIRDLRDDCYAIDRLDIEHPPILYYIEDDWFCKFEDLYVKGLLQRNDIYILNTIEIKNSQDFKIDDKISKVRNVIHIDHGNHSIVDYLDGFVYTRPNSLNETENNNKTYIDIINKRPIYLREFIHTFDNENSSIKKFNIQVEGNTIGSYTKDELMHNLHFIYWDFLVDKVRITDVINIFIRNDSVSTCEKLVCLTDAKEIINSRLTNEEKKNLNKIFSKLPSGNWENTNYDLLDISKILHNYIKDFFNLYPHQVKEKELAKELKTKINELIREINPYCKGY